MPINKLEPVKYLLSHPKVFTEFSSLIATTISIVRCTCLIDSIIPRNCARVSKKWRWICQMDMSNYPRTWQNSVNQGPWLYPIMNPLSPSAYKFSARNDGNIFRGLRCKRWDRRVKQGVTNRLNLTRKYLHRGTALVNLRNFISPDKIAISPKVDVGRIGAKDGENRRGEEQVYLEDLSHD